VKNGSGLLVELSRNDGSSTSAPDKTKFRLFQKFVLASTSALIFCTVFGLSQSAQAEDTFAVAGIKSTLPAWSVVPSSAQPNQPQQQDTDNSAISALSSFAQQLGGEPASATAADSKFDDQAIAELQAFAHRIGAGQRESIKDQPKLAEADNLLDWLNERSSGSSSAPAATAPRPPAAKAKRSSAPVDAHFVGGKVCMTCHASQAAEFQKTLMGKIGTTQKGKFECENCHGPGSAHVKAGGGRGVGGILSFGSDDPRTVEERNGVCLGCHQKGERTYWAGSVHETRGVACTNCHTVMKSVSRKHNLKTESEPETCFQCHQLKRAQMQYSSHMPIREGKLTCSNCHNPHGSITDKLIREASVNENCYKCHAEKRGPKLWEHAPVRENCLNCHQPHGSNYEFLLKVARPRLCNECHSTVHSPTAGGGFGTPNSPYMLGRACGNCHSNIHGSNKPNGMFFLR
jgi:DmsE family decaheme c-type cytochrome